MTDVIGIQAVRAVLRDAPARGRTLYLQQGRRDARVNELIGLARAAGVRYQSVESAWFKRRVAEGAHQGVLLECHELAVADEKALSAAWSSFGSQPLILVLDGVTDPRNFGACLRTAAAAGVDAVVVPKRNSAPLSAVALKTAQGGAENLLIVAVSNLSRCLKQLQRKGVWVIGADGEAEQDYQHMDARGPLALVMGSEGRGLRRLTRENCDLLVKIPMSGNVSSLNVSVASGVLLFEILRQRGAD